MITFKNKRKNHPGPAVHDQHKVNSWWFGKSYNALPMHLSTLQIFCLCIMGPNTFCMGLLCRFHCLCVFHAFSLNFFLFPCFIPVQIFLFYHSHHHHFLLHHHHYYYHSSVCFLMREEKVECGFV